MRPWTSVFVGLLTLAGAPPARAGLIPSIGNDPAPTVYFIQGQSFTPSIPGDRGISTPTVSPTGTVFLTQFRFDFAAGEFGVPPAVLYIYGFEPSQTEVHNGGQGSLGAGTHIGDGVYAFANVEVPFNTKSFAVLPNQRSIFDGSGNLYAGGVDLFPQGGGVREGNGNFDAGFTASFAPPPVSEPTTLMLFGTGVLGLLGRGWVRRVP
jgi:PEP-CTERM motif-containing protein